MAINLLDITSNNNDLTNNGATEVTTGLPFVASSIAIDLEFDSSQDLSISDALQTGLDLSGDFTIESWVKFESTPASGGRMIIAAKFLSTGNQRSYSFALFNNAGTLQLDILLSGDGSTTEGYVKNWTPSTGTWYHVAAIRDGTAKTVEFVVDGSSIGSSSAGTITTLYNGTAPFTVGSLNSANYFDGQIDDLRVWNDKRTVAEVAANMSVELTGTEGNLVAYWPWEEIGVATSIKSWNGLADASIKTYNGLAKASRKNWNGLA